MEKQILEKLQMIISLLETNFISSVVPVVLSLIAIAVSLYVACKQRKIDSYNIKSGFYIRLSIFTSAESNSLAYTDVFDKYLKDQEWLDNQKRNIIAEAELLWDNEIYKAIEILLQEFTSPEIWRDTKSSQFTKKRADVLKKMKKQIHL